MRANEGAGVGSVAAHAAVSPLLHLASAPPAPARPSMSFRHSRADRVQLGLGLICFCAFLTEGALADWSAVWLHDKAHASEAMAALGYAAFAGAMTTMRMVGDRLLEFFGSVRLLRTLIALGTLALAGALALARVDTAMIASCCWAWAWPRWCWCCWWPSSWGWCPC